MVNFGDPSTWEMNVDQFIDSGLPKEKPQELLDLQEQNRKGRLLDSLNKIGGGLEDSSLDFIRRENFAEKGVAKIRPRGLDSTRSKTGLDRMSDLLLKAYAEDDILHLANMPKRDTMNLSYFLAREDNIKYLSKKSGLKTEDIFDLLDDREAYLELEKRNISQTAGAETRLKPQREFYRKAEDWITKNAKRYDDPEKFKKAFKRTFPKNNLLLDAINSNKESLNVQFSDSFKSEMFGTGEGLTLGGRSKKQVEVTSKIKDLSIPRRSVDAVFKTAIYNLNPTVRNKLLNEFKNIVPKNKPSNKDLYNIKQSIRNNKLFKKFGVEKSIKGPIARLLYKDLGDNLSKQISALRQPRLQTTSLLRVFRDLVDPKYKNQFTEALSAIESANKKDIPEAKAKLNIAENINFDHKIPKSFIDAGYADEINYIKLNPTLESFNQGAKLNEFDRPMLAKARKYEAASKQEKPKILKEMQDIQSNFNERHANYLSNVTIKDVKGKPYFESTDLPLTKETNVKKLIEENIKFKPGMQSEGRLVETIGIKPTDTKSTILSKIKKAPIPNKTKAILLPIVIGATAITGADLMTGSVEAAEGAEETKKVLPSYGEAAGLTTAAAIGSKATKADPLKGLRRFGKEGAKNLLKGIFKVAGAPTAAAGFGAYELGQGNIKSAGASLLAPELVGSLAPAGKGVLSRAGSILMNPFGKAARAFTPVGLATIAGGAAYDVYKETKRRQELTDEERLQEDIEAQEKDDEMMVGAAEGGRIGFSNGSDATTLAIEKSLKAFERYFKLGGKLSYKDFIASGNEGVSKFFNSGGRVGFADGPDDPNNPGRRKFMKLAAGLASLPILGKFFKVAEKAAPLVQQIKNSSTAMPDWFPNFVDKFIGRSIGKKIDADFMEYTNPDLPNIKLSKSDDGKILIEGRNEFSESYNINYEPPGYEVLDYKTGKSVKTKGEFEAVEGRHVALGPEDYDTDPFYAEDLDELFTSDVAEMEKYATGNVSKTVKDAFGKETGLKKGKYDVDMAQGQAENRADILRDEGLDEID